MAVTVSTALLNKVRDSVSDYRVNLNKFEEHRDGTYNPIKAFMTITLDTQSFMGDIRINNMSIEQPNADDPNDLHANLPSNWNKNKQQNYENIRFLDPRVAEAVRIVAVELYEDELDRQEK